MVGAVPSWLTLTRQQMEARRLEAARDFEQGALPAEVARKHGVSRQSAWAWQQKMLAAGRSGLRQRRAPGPAPRLSPQQAQQLAALLRDPPWRHGFEAEVWSAPRVQAFILERYEIQYHPRYVPTLLRRLGFTRRRPDRQALEKDLEKKRQWLEAAWVPLQKNSQRARRSSSSTKPASH